MQIAVKSPSVKPYRPYNRFQFVLYSCCTAVPECKYTTDKVEKLPHLIQI